MSQPAGLIQLARSDVAAGDLEDAARVLKRLADALDASGGNTDLREVARIADAIIQGYERELRHQDVQARVTVAPSRGWLVLASSREKTGPRDSAWERPDHQASNPMIDRLAAQFVVN